MPTRPQGIQKPGSGFTFGIFSPLFCIPASCVFFWEARGAGFCGEVEEARDPTARRPWDLFTSVFIKWTLSILAFKTHWPTALRTTHLKNAKQKRDETLQKKQCIKKLAPYFINGFKWTNQFSMLCIVGVLLFLFCYFCLFVFFQLSTYFAWHITQHVSSLCIRVSLCYIYSYFWRFGALFFHFHSLFFFSQLCSSWTNSVGEHTKYVSKFDFQFKCNVQTCYSINVPKYKLPVVPCWCVSEELDGVCGSPLLCPVSLQLTTIIYQGYRYNSQNVTRVTCSQWVPYEHEQMTKTNGELVQSTW